MVYFPLGNDPLKEGGNGEPGVEIKPRGGDGKGTQDKEEGLS